MEKVKETTGAQVDEAEEFRIVEGFELYKVSNLGNVLSLRSGNLLNLPLNGYGYPQITLSNEKEKKSFKVHRLVADAFLLNPCCKPTVNHKDGIKNNNHVSNLEWATHSENIKHAFATGLKKANNPNVNGRHQGEKHSRSKLSNSAVAYIRENAKKNGGTMTNAHLGRMYGVNKATIGLVVKGQVWKHLIKGVVQGG